MPPTVPLTDRHSVGATQELNGRPFRRDQVAMGGAGEVAVQVMAEAVAAAAPAAVEIAEGVAEGVEVLA